MKKGKKLLIKLAFIVFSIYIIYTLINQQQTLNQYAKNKKEIQEQIAEQNEYKTDLLEQKEDINSMEFIEATAREKLDMYLPNEKVYIDQGM